jgi:CRISPR/Cas system CSM-associated protein Csm3 (group 7 of RAMP superfamily)
LRAERIEIAYRLTFESAFHFGTGMGGGLMDRLVARNTDGFLYVPGSTVKGVLRERCEQLVGVFGLQATSPHLEEWREANHLNPDIVARIFGTRFLPGTLYFDDAQMISEDRVLFETEVKQQRDAFKARQIEQRTQVALSRRTRTAQHGMLYTSEYGIRNLHFEGEILGMLTGFPVEESPRGTFSLLLLLTGLKSLEHIGGSKSTGAGKVTIELIDCSIDGETLDPTLILEQLQMLEYYQLYREEA